MALFGGFWCVLGFLCAGEVGVLVVCLSSGCLGVCCARFCLALGLLTRFGVALIVLQVPG